MMAADNQTTIAGNLVETPELRFTNTGTPVTNLRVAVTQRIQQDGEWRDGETSFFKVKVWRGQAEHLADSLAKGDRVMVTGRLRQRSWETPEGEKRSVAEIEADEVGASLKFATAKVERATERATERASSDRTRAGSGRLNAAATSPILRRSDSSSTQVSALGSSWGALIDGSSNRDGATSKRLLGGVPLAGYQVRDRLAEGGWRMSWLDGSPVSRCHPKQTDRPLGGRRRDSN
jgi:single-strand DNA-binding protein